MKRIRWSAILPFAGPFLFIVLALCQSWSSPDIWYHLTWGRSLVENFSFYPETRTLLQQPIYANVYWLFQSLIYALYSFGDIYLVSLFFILIWLAISILWIDLSKAHQFEIWGPLAFLIFALCVQPRFETRPEALSFLFLSVMLVLLTRLNLKQKLTPQIFASFGLTQILWTNCHGYAAFGPLLVLAYLASMLWDRQRWSKQAYLRGFGLFGFLLACSLVSPFGWKAWQNIWALWQVSSILKDLNAELMPLYSFDVTWPYQIFWTVLVLISGFGIFNLVKRQNSFASLIALGGSILAISALRNGPLFLILSAPLVGELLDFAKKSRALRRRLELLRFAPSALALGLSLTVVTGFYFKKIRSLSQFGFRLEKSAYPIDATEFLRKLNFAGKIFSDSYDGGYLTFHLPKDGKAFGDSYFSDGSITLSYFKATLDFSAFNEFHQLHNFDAVLLNIENIDFLDSILKSQQWKLVFVDSHRLLFLHGERFKNVEFDFNQMKFFDGADLRHWTYQFAAESWAGIAFKYQNNLLMKKIVRDFSQAPHVPGLVVKYALSLATKTNDLMLMKETIAMADKIFFSSTEDELVTQQIISEAISKYKN